MCIKNGEQFICQTLSKKQRQATKKAHERHQNLSDEKKQKYGCERYKNLPKHKKQRLVEYRKNCFKKWNNASQVTYQFLIVPCAA